MSPPQCPHLLSLSLDMHTSSLKEPLIPGKESLLLSLCSPEFMGFDPLPILPCLSRGRVPDVAVGLHRAGFLCPSLDLQAWFTSRETEAQKSRVTLRPV